MPAFGKFSAAEVFITHTILFDEVIRIGSTWNLSGWN